MLNVKGNWVGIIRGTNTGNVFVEMNQEGGRLSGIARLNDPMYGTAVYFFEGVLDGNRIKLEMRPDRSTIGQTRKQSIKINNRPVTVETPAVSYGDISADAIIQEDFTISGKWISTIGTGGTLFLRNDSIIEMEKKRIAQSEVKNQAFVMMSISPEDAELEDVLNAIKRAMKKYEIDCKRVDEVPHSGKITDLILEYIKISKYLVCDITKERPNVYYELGYAHGIGREVILIAKHGSSMHFDIKDYNTIFYRNLTDLESSLEKRIESIGITEAQQTIATDR